MNTSTPTPEYMILFRGSKWDDALSADDLQERMDKIMGWFEGLRQQGRVKAAQPLGAEGRTISGKKGLPVADGPFVESKETVGGFLIFQADDLDEATEIARTCPSLQYGVSIEVRPVLDECPSFKRAKERLAQAAV